MKKVDYSIKAKILSFVIPLVIVPLIILGATAIYLSYSSTQNLLSTTMKETAKQAASHVEYKLSSYLNIVSELGRSSRLSNTELSVDEKMELISERVKTYNFLRGDIIGPDGISISNKNDYSDREYFKNALNGKSSITSPIMSKVSGELSIIICAPLWENGIENSKIIGAIIIVPQINLLSEITNNIKVSDKGSSYIIDKTGTVIAHENEEYVETLYSVAEQVKTDSTLQSLATLEKEMINGSVGFGEYKFKGQKKILAYAPINNTDGWSIGINAPAKEFMNQILTSIFVIVVLLLLSIIITIIIIIKLANEIGSPIKQCAQRLDLLVQGDLKSSVPEIKTKDENRVLADSTAKIVENLNIIIKDEEYLMGEMANGNFAIKSRAKEKYVGDFKNVLTSIKKINQKLNSALSEINQTSNEVAISSSQVSSVSQALSDGASKQAASLEELTATISNVANQTSINANNAQKAIEESKNTGDRILDSNNKMKEMIEAMSKISGKSHEIRKIIKTIEDIAFQTNILALNAAVEAARAGEAGKGFAVVADEVRNLASKSAQAAKNTTELIEETISSIESGTFIADNTALSMTTVVESSKNVISLVDQIATASVEQSVSIDQITQGIEQISLVVQSNSATAEESAATSFELSKQADLLRDLVHQFNLKDNDNTNYSNVNDNKIDTNNILNNDYKTDTNNISLDDSKYDLNYLSSN